MTLGTEILIIGGGATGLGVARDCALRGFKTILVEKGDLAHGTSGRYHGLLHSGGRYAVRDRASARDCIVENRILRRTFPDAIEDTGGLFVVTPNDPPEYANPWLAACAEVGIPVEEIPIALALKEEPLLNPKISRAFRVPDAACDSFDLLHALAASVREAGGEVYLRHRVESLIVEGGRVCGAVTRNVATDERLTLRAEIVVNCTGAWAGQIAAMAGCELRVTPGKGTMIAMNSRLVNTAVNRCHPPDDGDILVPVGTVSVIGTTEVVVENPDQYAIEVWEVEKLLAEGEVLVPRFREFRALRAWAGVRPLFEEGRGKKEEGSHEGDENSRLISRAHSILDHETRDGVGGLISVVGGKLTTFRLMAEQAADLVCRKMNVTRECRTAEIPASEAGKTYHIHGARLGNVEHRGDMTGRIGEGDEIICECELVTRAQVEEALKASASPVLNDLRRDLRLGMGPCQAGFCAYRAAGILNSQLQMSNFKLQIRNPQSAINSALLEFLQERWKGLRPVMWGANLKQLELDLTIYRHTLAADRLPLAREPEEYPTEKTA
ncbi:MAG: anaerobic glycerol-3-phosphate dehydrogenase subunit A [Chloroflexi bacterium]|nr:anaerobic glycerol-3-phosphate dehydrogenase subunit A [Chloroflexota bacterium]